MKSRLRLLRATEGPSGETTRVEVSVRPAERSTTALVAALALLLALSLLAASGLRRSRSETALVAVTVARGDTLWGLARRHCGPGEYLPKAVYEIRRANGLSTSRLMPGQRLVIPVKTRVQTNIPACMSVARVGTP